MAESQVPNCSQDVDDTSWVPKVDMVFKNDEEAYKFYNDYAKMVGFSVRKAWVNRRASGVINSRTYVCYKEGFQGNKKDEDEVEVKRPRDNERTGCLAHMIIKIMEDGRYRVSEFHPMHNHELVPPTNAHVLKSHRAVKKRKANVKSVVPQMSMIEYLVRRAGGYRQVNFVSVEDAADKNWAPKIDMEFENDEKAYQFYTEYGRRIGFDVRKAWVNRKSSGVIVSRTYVCYKEGFYGNKKDGSEVEKHKLGLNERTGCLARMIIKLSKNGMYRVSEFNPSHNHQFVTARNVHTLKSYRAAGNSKSSSDDTKVAQNPQVSLPVKRSRKRHASTKSKYGMKIGDVGAILQYMQDKQANDHSFYYAIRLDEEDHKATVFWADGRSVIDYTYFDDVICFDMTYKNNNHNIPLAPFYGINHHRQLVFFGAALLYDETEESLKWLFQTFNTVMYGKQPRVILTDLSELICNAISSVWQDTTQRSCVWHIYYNAKKHLSQVFQGSRTFALDFGRCLYDCEDDEDFLSSWANMLEKYDLKDNAWLNKLFKDREKWALPYGRDLFCADMKSIQRSDNLNSMFKECLSQGRDLLKFFEHYEGVITKHRHEEELADFSPKKSDLLIVPSRMVRQAANVYTPVVFDIFQREFEMSVDCMVYKRGEIETVHEYMVTNEEKTKEHLVKFDSLNGAICCSCKKFEFMGIQCRHVLKTLDILNIKELPPQYFLKRWRKDAKFGVLRDNHGFGSNVDSKLSKAQRYNSLCHIFHVIAAKAAQTLEGYSFIEDQSEHIVDNVNRILITRPPEEPSFC